MRRSAVHWLWLCVPLLVLLVWLGRIDWEARTEQWLAGATGAEVEIESAHWQLLHPAGLVLRGCDLRGAGVALASRTGIGATVEAWELRCDRADLGFRWTPWSGRGLVLRSVNCVGSCVHVTGGGEDVALAGYDWRVRDLQWEPGENIAGRFAAEAQGLALSGLDLASVHCHGNWSGSQVHVIELAGRLGGGEARISGDLVGVLSDTVLVEGDLRWDGVPTGELFGSYWPQLAAHLEGPVTGHMTGHGRWRGGEWDADALVAHGEVALHDGVLRLGSWLGAQDNHPDWTIARLTHRFQLTGRRYQIETFETAGDIEAQAVGWLDVGGDIAVSVVLRLPPGFTPDLGALSFAANMLRDGTGRIRLGVDLSGETRAPRMSLNLRGGRRR